MGLYFMMFAAVLIFVSILVYLGGIPCKERIPVDDVEYPFLCPRCTGFYVGVILFNITILFFHFYGAPILSIETGCVFFLFGVLFGLPAMWHGIMRRYYKKDFSPKISLIILYLSGFAVAMGGFLVAWSLIILLK
jgi:hypothetical protein